jgi:uncharacterized membrane protein YraQ (UPF0718 family)
LGAGSEAAGDSRPPLVVSGTVVRGTAGAPVTDGTVEIRWPAHDDQFEPVSAPIREDGAFRLEVAHDALPPDPAQLTLSVIAPGFEIYEQPLPTAGEDPASPVTVDIQLTASTLDGVLDIFSCCVLSWGVLTVMLPAFLLGAAITAFVPSQHLLKYLGPDAPKPVAYGAAVGSGMVLSLCSCNVVPLFVSIWQGGAGIGPAFAFLYAGPAINLVATVFTCQVIGLGIGIFRVIAVAVLSVIVGLIMARVFGSRQRSSSSGPLAVASIGPDLRITGLLLALLLFLLVVGAFEMALWLRLLLTLPAVGALVWIAVFKLGRDYTRQWLRETYGLLMKVIPILIPAILIIGVFAQKVPLRAVTWLTGSNDVGANLFASVFGAFMYFPILTETPFVKAMLKVMGMTIGPAMALLLTAPGLSLPGMIIVSRDIGWKKVGVYVATLVVLATLTGLFFGSKWGAYICSCTIE